MARNRYQQRMNIGLAPWVVNELLSDIPNVSRYLEELIIKDRMRKVRSKSQKLKNESEEKPLNHAPMPYWSGAPLCLVPSDFGVLT